MSPSALPPTLTVSTQATVVHSRRYLLVISNDSSQVHALPDLGTVRIGRASEAELRLDDPGCSRHHARLHLAADALHLEDLGSHNGTRLNNRPIAGTIALESGDVIAIGKSVLVVHAPPADAPPILVDPATLRDRCTRELERAVRYDRPVALVAVGLSQPVEWAALERAAAAELRRFDVAAVTRDGDLLALLPELEDAALEAAQRLVAALVPFDAEVRAGVSHCPRDGCQIESLIAAARHALALARPGCAQALPDREPRVQLGDRSALVADPAMEQIYHLLRRLAITDLPVLITGETGVGKENAAYALHAWSSRAQQPFVAINCAALHAGLIESELFGHERGAFSGAVAQKLGLLESADGGTVFLDEIGELPLADQAKLLRVLETQQLLRVGGVRERPIDIRVVAATNRRLAEEVEAGRFRRDLFYRVVGATVALPPLRDRPCEIALLAGAFLDEARTSAGRPAAVLSVATTAALARYGWPGNVRELKNEMAYVAATTDEVVIEPWHLSERLAATPPGTMEAAAAAHAGAGSTAPFQPIAEEIRDLERERMRQALAAAGHVQKRAAELIAMPIRTFRMKAKQYRIDRGTR